MDTKSDEHFLAIEATIEANKHEDDRNQVENGEKLTKITGLVPAQDVPYCKDENLDHKIRIYCNLIGPLAALRHSSFLCKKVLRCFGKFRQNSDVRIIQYDWLIVLTC